MICIRIGELFIVRPMRQYGSFFRKVLDKPSEKDLLLYRHKPRSLENFWFCNDFSHNIYYFFTPVKIFSLHSVRAINSAIIIVEKISLDFI